MHTPDVDMSSGVTNSVAPQLSVAPQRSIKLAAPDPEKLEFHKLASHRKRERASPVRAPSVSSKAVFAARVGPTLKKCPALTTKDLKAKKELEEADRRASAALILKKTLLEEADSISPSAPSTHLGPSKRRKAQDINTCRPVWLEGDYFDNGWTKSFIDMEDEHKTQVKTVDATLAASAIRDGFTILSNGSKFCVNSLENWSSSKWSFDLASKIMITVDEKRRITAINDGGQGIEKIGSGNYNVVFKMLSNFKVGYFDLPKFVYGLASSQNCVATRETFALRVTRPDNDEGFSSIEIASTEATNSMYAALNGIGVEIYAISNYLAPRSGRTLRYGSVYVMERAQRDVYSEICECGTFGGGVQIAKQVVHLIFKASICGVAFFDLKPANVLVFQRDYGKTEYRFTDFDPSFFFIVNYADWKALMLVNLSLFSAHVRNMPTSECVRGFCSAVKPVLNQLIRRRWEYDSGWLFDVKCVDVDFFVPEDDCVFELQRVFVSMTTSYFHGPQVKNNIPSSSWKWIRHRQNEINEYWKDPLNQNSWPPNWKRHSYAPLISQLVAFATC